VTTVINLYGGPGLGKSTLAASVYSELMKSNLNVELVREYVKDWAWEGRKIGKYDQMYFLVQQFKREAMLFNKVDYIITDSPFLLASFYAKYYHDQEFLINTALSMREMCHADGIVFKDYLIQRQTQYNPNGRYETEEQAITIDNSIEQFLNHYNIHFSKINNNNNDLIKTLIPFHSWR